MQARGLWGNVSDVFAAREMILDTFAIEGESPLRLGTFRFPLSEMLGDGQARPNARTVLSMEETARPSSPAYWPLVRSSPEKRIARIVLILWTANRPASIAYLMSAQ